MTKLFPNRASVAVLIVALLVVSTGLILFFRHREANSVAALRRQQIVNASEFVTSDKSLGASLRGAKTFRERASLLDEKWSDLKLDTDATDARAVHGLVADIRPEFDETLDTLPNPDDFTETLEAFVLANARREPSRWYGLLGERGYTLARGYRMVLTEDLNLNVPRDDQSLACARLMAANADRMLNPVTFPSLSDDGTRAIAYALSPDELQNGTPPSKLIAAVQTLRGHATTQTSAFEPARQLQAIATSEGSVSVCEVLLFGETPKDDTKSRRVAPVLLYAFFDPQSGHWTISAAYAFPVRDGNTNDDFTVYL